MTRAYSPTELAAERQLDRVAPAEAVDWSDYAPPTNKTYRTSPRRPRFGRTRRYTLLDTREGSRIIRER